MTMKISINDDEKAAVLKRYKAADKKEKALMEDMFGKETFEPNIMEQITDLDSALIYNGETMDQFRMRTVHDTDHELAYKELCAIALALNQGKPMDYKDMNVNKYYPYFRAAGSGSGFSSHDCIFGCACDHSSVGARLCVNTAEKAQYMGKQFIEIYNRYING